MVQKRVRATSAKSARRKGGGKTITVTKVNYIKGSKKGRYSSYSVTTKKKQNDSNDVSGISQGKINYYSDEI